MVNRMKTCTTCKQSYIIDECCNYRGCKLVDIQHNIPLKTLGEEGKCPYYSERLINNGWGAK